MTASPNWILALVPVGLVVLTTVITVAAIRGGRPSLTRLASILLAGTCLAGLVWCLIAIMVIGTYSANPVIASVLPGLAAIGCVVGVCYFVVSAWHGIFVGLGKRKTIHLPWRSPDE